MKTSSKLHNAFGLFLLASAFCLEAVPAVAEPISALPQTSRDSNQKKGVVGQIFDEIGEPIIGASILVEGTTIGTVSDIDGNFALANTAPGTKLQISFIGYETQHLIAASTNMTIVLEPDNKTLEETVVIGYGIQKKSNVTGAISSLKAADFENSVNTNAAAALQGKVSGVQVVNNSGQPGAAPTIRVRGYSSNGSSDPLYIVDGLKVSDISYLEPSSIQSMEVLKDAATAAIYGAEAGNGVVLITTKGGAKGKTRIGFDGSWSFSNLANKVELMNAKQYKEYYTEALGSGFTTLYDQYYDGKTDTDWQDEMYETGVMQKYNVNVSAGNDNGQMYLALGYMDNDGIMVRNNDSYQRITGQINASYKIRKWLDVSTTNTITQTNSRNISESNVQYGLMQNIMWMDPFTPKTYSSLSAAPSYVNNAVNNGYNVVKDGDGKYPGVSFMGNDNPYSALVRGSNHTESFYLNGMTSFNLTPFQGFTFTSRLGYTLGYKTIDENSPSTWTKWNQEGNGQKRLGQNEYTSRYYQWENFANYVKETSFGNWGVMAGMSWIDSKTNYLGGLTDEVSNEASNFQYLSYSTGAANDFVYGYPTFKRQIAYYGRLSWDWLNRYSFQVNFRADSYDSAYLDMDHNWGYFPSVSAGWTFSNEEFFKPVIDSGILTFGKLRASYGVNGSISNLGGYAYAATLNSGSTDGVSQNAYWMNGHLVTGIYPGSTLANPKLRWERSKQFDLGLNLRFFNDRLTFDYDYYNKVTDGLLVQSVAPLTTGANYVYQNVGEVTNQGHEFEVEWHDHIGDFGYSVKASLATVKNNVSEYQGEGVRLQGTRLASSSHYLTYFEEGYPLWYIRGYQLDGVDKTTGEAIYKDLNNDGVITDADRTNLGSGIPDYTYGITLACNYKGFDLQVYGAGQSGNKLVYGVVSASPENYGNLPTWLYDNRWTSGSTSATLPSATNQRDDRFYNSDQFVYDASFFKIKQIQLGYTLPQKMLQKIGMQQLRAYVSLDNFFTFTDYPGQDPEVNASGNTSQNGFSAMAIDFAGYPIAKSVSLGVNVAF